MATYILIPGAWHGAWCWERVTPLLTDAGHRVVAIDLPCEDASLGCAAYRDIALDAIGDADENVDPFTNTVHVTISRLRRKLGEPPAIETIPNIGYRIREDA